MSLRTEKILRRRKWTELPTTEEVIKQVHAFAINENRSEEDDLSVDNNDTGPNTDQELTIDETDDDEITADGDDTYITADGDNTSITTDGDDTQQDETDPITDTNNENTHEDVQMETAVLETDEDQGAPQIENQGANEEEEK